MKCSVSWCEKEAKKHRPYCAAHGSLSHDHPEYTPDEMAVILADKRCKACHADGARYWRYTDGPFGYRVCKSCHDAERSFLTKGIVPKDPLNLMRCAWAVGGSEIDNEQDLRSYLCQLADARNVGHSCPLCVDSHDAPPANLPTTNAETSDAMQTATEHSDTAQPSSVSVNGGCLSLPQEQCCVPAVAPQSEEPSIWTTWRVVPYIQRTPRATRERGATPKRERVPKSQRPDDECVHGHVGHIKVNSQGRTYCAECKRIRQRKPKGDQAPRPLPDNLKHGRIWTYQNGCRCDECKAVKRASNAKTNPVHNAKRKLGGGQ